MENRQFLTTRWSLVEAAGGSEGERARAALRELCAESWDPLYAFVLELLERCLAELDAERACRLPPCGPGARCGLQQTSPQGQPGCRPGLAPIADRSRPLRAKTGATLDHARPAWNA